MDLKSASTIAALTLGCCGAAFAQNSILKINVGDSPQFGNYLEDGSGRVVYMFTSDKRSVSSCYGNCARAWPPLIATATPQAGFGVDGHMLGSTKRSDGK